MYLGTFFIPAAALLKARLQDMQEYMTHSDAPKSEGKINRVYEHFEFNGVVLFALHSCGYFHPSGYASRSVSLLNALRNAGIETCALVRLGYPWDIGSSREKFGVSKIEYSGIGFHLRADAIHNLDAPESDYIKSYASWIMERSVATGASVLHASSNYLNGLAVARAGRISGIRTVYEVRGLWHITKAFSDAFYEGSEHYCYVERRELEACHAVDQVVTLSGSMKSWLVARGIPEEKIAVVGNAANSPTCSDAIDLRKRVRAQHGIAEEDYVIGYLGSLVAYEGLDLLIKGLQKLPKEKRPFILLVGGGKAEAGLRRLAKKLGVAERVIFGGRVSAEQVSSYYYAMDVVALPRKDHTLTRLVPAIKPYEVLAHSRPLLVSPALASALEDTLDPSNYQVVDFESPYFFYDVIDHDLGLFEMGKVPTWDDRATQLTRLYNDIF